MKKYTVVVKGEGGTEEIHVQANSFVIDKDKGWVAFYQGDTMIAFFREYLFFFEEVE